MKNLIFFCILIIFACKDIKKAEKSTADLPIHFDWLSGSWQRSNDDPGQQTYEQWAKANDSLYLGLGFTMQDKDTIWQENVKLLLKDSIWIYSVTGKGDSMSTDFVLTSTTTKSFICENPENEFPKKIEYVLEGDSLKAKISGGGPDVAFIFGK